MSLLAREAISDLVSVYGSRDIIYNPVYSDQTNISNFTNL
jgi:hypothetical protein